VPIRPDTSLYSRVLYKGTAKLHCALSDSREDISGVFQWKWSSIGEPDNCSEESGTFDT
jgi:hypothetical protein